MMNRDNEHNLFNLANEKFEQKMYEDAIVFFKTILEHNENSQEAFKGKIECLLKLDKPQEVLTECNKYSECFGFDSWLYHNRGLAKSQLFKYEDAIKDYEQAIELDPKNALIYNDLGFSYSSLRDCQTAKVYFDKAIYLNPEYSMAYHNRAMTNYYCNVPFDEILKDCYTAIKLDGQNIMARNHLIEKLILSKQYNTALEHLKYAEDIPHMTMLCGIVYYCTDQKDKAINCFIDNYSNINWITDLYKTRLQAIKNVIKLNSENNYILPRIEELNTILKIIKEIYDCINENNFEFCSFCKNPLHSSKKYIKHNDIIICEECLELCNEILQDEKCLSFEYLAKYPNPKLRNENNPTCSFCGRNSSEVEKLISGPNDIMICNGCVGVCNEIFVNNSDFKTEYQKATNRATLHICAENISKKQFDILNFLKIIFIISIVTIIIFAKFYKM